MTNQDPIEKEIAQADAVPSVAPEVLQLDKCRIMTDTNVPSEDFLMRMYGKPCFPRRDISAITGTEKCGKTFFTSMLMACCATRNVLELERIQESPLKVMWYDTEQSRQSTKSILTDRVFKLGDADESNFFVFNVRSCSCQERINYLVAGIETYKPDMVIIDNVSDLLPSINDPEASAQVIDQLMQLSTENDCNITIVIHLNRTGEKRGLRGWLGTEILHKAFDVYYCEQIEKTDVFSVEQTFTRKYRIPELMYYKIDEKGLPEITTKPNFQPRNQNGQYMTNKPEAYQIKSDKVATFNQKYIIHHDGSASYPWEWALRPLFTDAFGNIPSLPLENLQNAVMKLSEIKQPKYYEKVFNMAVGQRVISTTMDKRGRVVAILIPS
ncbi:AAA family ATPase [Prevotella sp. MA2016]|uniref:AAA family ATPase n=1 Tax=Prevotella sp. MA2016 TaxID=1408310 RepID=UPI00048B3F8D|nr:AAA family ATPase [Prevotella sp. MA2016]